MNPVPELAPQLKQLHLSGILDSLEARNRQAIDAKLAYTEFLALLIGDEVARREQKKFSLRLRRAQFRTTKTLEQFDFERLPQLNRALVHDLATGRYLQENPERCTRHRQLVSPAKFRLRFPRVTRELTWRDVTCSGCRRVWGAGALMMAIRAVRGNPARRADARKWPSGRDGRWRATANGC